MPAERAGRGSRAVPRGRGEHLAPLPPGRSTPSPADRAAPIRGRTRRARPALLLALAPARRPRRRRQRRRHRRRRRSALVFGTSHGLIGLLAIVGARRRGPGARARPRSDGSISVSAVGAFAGAALVRPAAALALAITIAAVEWSARRSPLHQLALQRRRPLARVARGRQRLHGWTSTGRSAGALTSSRARSPGAATSRVNTGLLSARDGDRGPRALVARVAASASRGSLPHYVVFGFIARRDRVAYDADRHPRRSRSSRCRCS